MLRLGRLFAIDGPGFRPWSIDASRCLHIGSVPALGAHTRAGTRTLVGPRATARPKTISPEGFQAFLQHGEITKYAGMHVLPKISCKDIMCLEGISNPLSTPSQHPFPWLTPWWILL